jgi:hypothetical protein
VQPYPAPVVVPVAEPAGGALTCLISRLVPSVRALVSPVVRNTSIAGHQVSIVSAKVVGSGMSASAHQRWAVTIRTIARGNGNTADTAQARGGPSRCRLAHPISC